MGTIAHETFIDPLRTDSAELLLGPAQLAQIAWVMVEYESRKSKTMRRCAVDFLFAETQVRDT